MNVSHKHKVIWLAPEKTATKIISQILSDYDFIFEPDNKDFKNGTIRGIPFAVLEDNAIMGLPPSDKAAPRIKSICPPIPLY